MLLRLLQQQYTYYFDFYNSSIHNTVVVSAEYTCYCDCYNSSIHFTVIVTTAVYILLWLFQQQYTCFSDSYNSSLHFTVIVTKTTAREHIS